MELGQHLNGDESMCFGASFYAANKTNLFRVRPIHFYHSDHRSRTMILDSKDYHKEVNVFSASDRYDIIKTYSLEAKGDLEIKVLYENSEDTICQVATENLQEQISNITQKRKEGNYTDTKLWFEVTYDSVIPFKLNEI